MCPTSRNDGEAQRPAEWAGWNSTVSEHATPNLTGLISSPTHALGGGADHTSVLGARAYVAERSLHVC